MVAPCPHDGKCPMDGTQSWCHFVQRFKRTAQQRTAKVGLHRRGLVSSQDQWQLEGNTRAECGICVRRHLRYIEKS